MIAPNTFLREIYLGKLARGDADAERFKTRVESYFAYGLNATISGATYHLRNSKPNPSATKEQRAERKTLLAMIEAETVEQRKAA